MFPTSRLGTIRTLALPAMSELGAFFAATAGTRAASDCSSPSTFRLGNFSFAIFVASITLSMTYTLLPVSFSIASFADPFV